ncbi:predicted protein [Naegleria gruberi]|uniref:mannose-1-phosphate guanylyltransferase n=1 Tax=Naegleria gruberi TaxID=5762 RepID=D2VYB3_NAEGR|nr:uncharacterized protein NAEGRDRAFT_74057 [Naegleria gruberi]EFC38171.1 predicted protein [Naegleria gruberi]|eukprot:XP_002670915.1 predicted protein [Naegleria gruberi strain NEG-M]
MKVKALILVGGYGTRLRPLTFSTAKPLIHFANKPIVVHQIEALKKAGCTEIVLAVNYKPQEMIDAMKKYEEKYQVKITYSVENEPLGTAGPLALARDILVADENEYFFVLNSDVICEYSFDELLDYHKYHGKEGTIMVTKVDDPSKYGVVVTQDGKQGEIEKFVEKPKTFVGDRINAGIYVFSTKVLERIELRPTSIEREIFPFMARDNELYAMDLNGFWMDIGQPKDYITGMCLYLSSDKHKTENNQQFAKNPEDGSYQIINESSVLVGENVKIGKGAMIGPNVVLGDNVIIEEGARVTRSTIFESAWVKQHALVKSSIIGWKSSVGKWSRVTNNTVLGEDTHVDNEIFVNEIKVLPHKTISSDVLEPGQIIM